MRCRRFLPAAEGTYGQITWGDLFRVDDEAAPGTPTCLAGDHLPFIATVAALLARSADAFLRSGQRIGYQITPRGIFLT